MPRVVSDTIEWIGYEDRGRTLFVRFSTGDLCSYDGVPRTLYAAFLKAESKDDFFEQSVQDHFVWRRLPDDGDEGQPSGRSDSHVS
jgi:hypothetical protein